MYFKPNEKKMLLDLFRLYGPSRGEKPILDFIAGVLTENSIPFMQDENGNIYCMNHMNAPMLSAHTDCVGTTESGHYVRFVDIYPYRDGDEIMKGIGNIGGDDKCGVFLILMYLLTGRPVNAIFSTQEEISGRDGIGYMMEKIRGNEVFGSIPYCLVLDRKNSGDIICQRHGYGSKRFEDELEKIGEKYGYKAVLGGVSDMNTIKKYMNGCNLSVGYHNPHSTNEFVSIADLFNTWKYIQDLIENLPRDIPFEPESEKPPVQPQYYGGYPANYKTWDGTYRDKSWWDRYGNFQDY